MLALFLGLIVRTTFGLAQRDLNQRDQLWRLERLQYEKLIGHPSTHVMRAAGYENHWNGGAGTNLVHCIDSATGIKLDISSDQIGAPALSRRYGVFFRYGEIERREAAFAQRLLDHHGDQRFVFDDQGMHRDSSPGSTMESLK
jgi:hypothetical protein